jgi:hypothetical protein
MATVEQSLFFAGLYGRHMNAPDVNGESSSVWRMHAAAIVLRQFSAEMN